MSLLFKGILIPIKDVLASKHIILIGRKSKKIKPPRVVFNLIVYICRDAHPNYQNVSE